MTEPITCEARLMGLSKTRRRDGDWFEAKFHIHPDDMTRLSALFLLPLGTACNLAISGVAESKDDAPDEPVKLKGGPICKRAVMKCKEEAFTIYLCRKYNGYWNQVLQHENGDTEHVAKHVLYLLCHIESRAELDHNLTAGGVFEAIESEYYASQHGETTEAFERMGEEGPG